MSYIFENREKNNKINWRNNKEMNSLANSAVTDKGLLNADEKKGEKSNRSEKKSGNSSIRQQIFHPMDTLY